MPTSNMKPPTKVCTKPCTNSNVGSMLKIVDWENGMYFLQNRIKPLLNCLQGGAGALPSKANVGVGATIPTRAQQK
uniref:Uncharacterized protein n=1 Tax=Romanomermis culicivorax TaxID=13658 RepID=A0A915KNK7_ROMCU